MGKIVLLTSDSLRHKYIANQLDFYLDLHLIITEQKSPKIEDTTHYSNDEAKYVTSHFKKRLESEQTFFSDYNEFPANVNHLQLAYAQINSQEVFEKIKAINPDRIILFGTSIIREPIMKEYEGKVINLHLGLSPYYKGSATNLFPIAFNELSCVGATIHVANKKVDQGPILHQLRPKLSRKDGLHDIGNKVILEAGKVLANIIKLHIENENIGKKQTLPGKVFRVKDVTPDLLKKAYGSIEKGIVREYLNDKLEIDKQYPIVELK